jgi:hypothetical protein
MLVTAAVSTAQDTQGLQQLRPGDRIGVVLRDGKSVRGRFEALDGTRLQFQKRDALLLADVKQVRVQRKASRWRAAGWGALIGFGIGFAIAAPHAGFISDRNDPPLSTTVGIGTGFGMFTGGIGAALGALAGGSKDELIYRSDK